MLNVPHTFVRKKEHTLKKQPCFPEKYTNLVGSCDKHLAWMNGVEEFCVVVKFTGTNV